MYSNISCSSCRGSAPGKNRIALSTFHLLGTPGAAGQSRFTVCARAVTARLLFFTKQRHQHCSSLGAPPRYCSFTASEFASDQTSSASLSPWRIFTFVPPILRWIFLLEETDPPRAVSSLRVGLGSPMIRLPALLDLYIHPLYVLVSKIPSSILNSSALIHPLYHHLSTLSTMEPTCHFI
jgi:hypothetical protein